MTVNRSSKLEPWPDIHATRKLAFARGALNEKQALERTHATCSGDKLAANCCPGFFQHTIARALRMACHFSCPGAWLETCSLMSFHVTTVTTDYWYAGIQTKARLRTRNPAIGASCITQDKGNYHTQKEQGITTTMGSTPPFVKFTSNPAHATHSEPASRTAAAANTSSDPAGSCHPARPATRRVRLASGKREAWPCQELRNMTNSDPGL